MLLKMVAHAVDPVVKIVDPYVADLTNFLTSAKTQRFLVKSLFVLVVVLGLLFCAALSYTAFYWIYVPKIAHRAPVYLQYDFGVDDQMNVTLHPPRAVVDISKQNAPFLAVGQEYDVAIDMVLPTSERNVALGNFMVKVDLLDASGTSVARSSRPAILSYQSVLVRMMQTMLRAVPLLFGFDQESQTISLTLLEGLVEDSASPITKTVVTVSTPHLQIYSMNVRFDAHFRGLRYLMYYHSIPTAIIFVLAFLFWETIFALIGWKLFVSWWHSKFGRTRRLGNPVAIRKSVAIPPVDRPSDFHVDQRTRGTRVESTTILSRTNDLTTETFSSSEDLSSNGIASEAPLNSDESESASIRRTSP